MPNPGKKSGLRAYDALLLLPVLALIFPSVYAQREPMLWGFPFFYWYQFAWVALSAALTAAVFVLRKRNRR